MEKIIFYIPFQYSFKSRLKKFPQKISWLIIYFFPVLFSFTFIEGIDVNFENICLSFAGISLIYCLYEIGYIYNDTETIKNEEKPTLRLSKENLLFYEKNKNNIYGFRFISALIISIVIYYFSEKIIFLIASWSIILLYIAYNSIRNRLNLPLHFCLVTLRFCSIPLLFAQYISVATTISLILLFPLLNTLERCRESRFNLPLFQKLVINNAKTGRYYYYLLLILVAMVSFIISYKQGFNTHVPIVFLIYSLYFFIYRLFSYHFMIKHH